MGQAFMSSSAFDVVRLEESRAAEYQMTDGHGQEEIRSEVKSGRLRRLNAADC